jgi:hypothetical protein
MCQVGIVSRQKALSYYALPSRNQQQIAQRLQNQSDRCEMTTMIATIRDFRIVAFIASILLTGCDKSNAPVMVVADSFCLAAKKKTWSVDDTPETIEQIVKYNAGIDRACGIKTTS